jgi:hypothetical protein
MSGQQVQQVCKEPKAIMAQQVRKAFKESKVQLAMSDLLDPLAMLVLQDRKVFRVQQVLLAHKVM